MQDIKDLQQKLLEMISDLDSFCKENGIDYVLCGGNVLGAVRHKGFIPWDDDMDFGVLEEYIPRLLNALEHDLPTYYKIKNIDNSSYISNYAFKIEDSRYEITEIEKENLKEKMGTYIDIFPLSRTNNKKSFPSRNWFAQILLRINWSRFLDYKKRGLFKYLFSVFFKVTFFLTPKAFIPYLVNKFIAPHKGSCITNYWGAWINKEIVPADVMGMAKLYKFEDCEFYGVAKVHEYLTSLYGKDYMDLPPKNKRHLHIREFKKKC